MNKRIPHLSVSFILILLVCSVTLKAQKSLSIERVNTAIKVDGLLDESWEQFAVVDGFEKHLPLDTGAATSNTEVRICYDDKYFYLFATCYETKQGKHIVQSLKRDFSFPRTDAFVVFIDPFNDGVNGFSFACNPYGAQREGVLEVGGQFGVTTRWDNKWYSATSIADSAWTVEMAIPFNSLRFNESNRTWKINFSRNDQKINETSAWVNVPRNFNVANLAFTADLNWSENPPVSGKNISVIPYAIAGADKTDEFVDAGLDAKIGITSALNLDLTVNPDFSNVDVDRQVTNLDRFELFFPEQRQFFIENSDLFSGLGSSNARPFFSRRIGIGTDTAGNQIEQPIIGGARLTGRLNKNWRLGVMSVQTGNGAEDNLAPENFSIASIQRKVSKRSNVGLFYLNKEKYDTDWSYDKEAFSRVAGAEFNLNSSNSKWQGKTYAHMSFDSSGSNGISQGAQLLYSTQNVSIGANQELVTDDFNSEAGFIRRKDYLYVEPYAEVLRFPENKKFISHGLGTRYRHYFDLDGKSLENRSTNYYVIKFNNTSKIQLNYVYNSLILRSDFDPSRSGGQELLTGDQYKWSNFTLDYLSNERKNFFVDFTGVAGQYYNGHRYGFNGSLRYRIVPKFVFSLNYSYDNIILPDPFATVDYTLLGPEIEVLLTTKLFWTTYIQYNEQADNININSRVQWRFKPASDLFIVYTDNYLPEDLGNKTRGVVVKFTYWFNI